jgi:hypothetical protein
VSDTSRRDPRPTVTIDGERYDATKLSETAQALVRNIRFCDRETSELRLRLSSMQTARQAYAEALKRELAGGPGRSNGAARASVARSRTDA